MKASRMFVAGLFGLMVPLISVGQSPPSVEQEMQPPPPPPATKLEGFKPSVGSVVTLGYDEIGRIGPGLLTPGLLVVEIRQLQSQSDSVQGLTVTVTESQYREEMAFVDEEEISDLIKGVDALLELKSNPTKFRNFEVRYTTKGELELVAFNNAKGETQFAVRAGRAVHAKRYLNRLELQKLRGWFQAASERLSQKVSAAE